MRVKGILLLEAPATGAIGAVGQRCQHDGKSTYDVEMHCTDAVLRLSVMIIERMLRGLTRSTDAFRDRKERHKRNVLHAR